MNTIEGHETGRSTYVNRRAALAELAGRTLLATLFLDSGLAKIGGYSATTAYMESFGVPGSLLPAVIGLELLGGIALVVGWKTRIASFLLAGFTLLAGAIFHGDLGDPGNRIHLLKNISIAGGFLLVIAHDPGLFSLDRRTGTG